MKNCKNIKVFFLLFVGLLLGDVALAQLPVVKTTVDKTNIVIGQRIDLQVHTSMPDNTYRLSWFAEPDTMGAFKIVSLSKIDSTAANGNLSFGQHILLTSFDSGRQVIPPLALAFSSLDSDSSFNMYTDSVVVNVGYAPADSVLPFHDIKTIIEVKKPFPWWAWALVAVAVILLLAWIVFLRKFLKKKNKTVVFESKLSPYDEAMQLLKTLEKERLPENKRPKEYYVRLTDIFKRYLSRKTNQYQLHLTADELLLELHSLDLPQEKISGYAACLRLANAVKFAKYLPADYDNEKSFEETKNIIEAIQGLERKKAEDGV